MRTAPETEDHFTHLVANKFNALVDGDTIMADLARKTKATVVCDGGVQFTPVDNLVIRRAVGTARTPRGLLLPVDRFFKLTAWQDDYARRLVKFLNYELKHDGAWAVLWTNPTEEGRPTEIRMAYQDVDGDVQFVIESELTLTDLQAKNDERRHGNVAEQAYQSWKQWLKDVDVQKNQKIKAAKGEQQRDPNVNPAL